MATINVNSFVDSIDPNDGVTTLREAILEANDGDTIQLESGTYELSLEGAFEDGGLTGDLDINGKSLTVLGTSQDETIIDANGIDRVFDVIGDVSVAIANVTITGGDAPFLEDSEPSNLEDEGGGIRLLGANLSLDSSTIQDNQDEGISGRGAGLIAVTNSTISGNGDEGIQGRETSEIVVTNSTISENDNEGIDGRGVGAITVTDSTISENRSQGIDGREVGAISVTNSVINGNNLEGIEGNDAGTITIIDSTISGNRLEGIDSRRADALTVTSSTISNNGEEGIVSPEIDTITITNSTISENRLQGIEGDNAGRIAVTSSTVSDNGHEGIDGEGADTIEVASTIVANNGIAAGAENPNQDILGDFTSGGNNLIGNGDGGTGFTDGVNGDIVGTTANPIDPRLGPLQDNGGPTLTQALLPDSPAIDAGSNPNTLTTDQRGAARVSGERADIGAVEYQQQLDSDQVIIGTEGRDALTGGSGNDFIDGASDDDILTGGAGSDTLTGGQGADRFIFDQLVGSGIDTITDFNHNGQGDTLILDSTAFELLDNALTFVSGISEAVAQGISGNALGYTTDGQLFYEGIHFATLQDTPTLTSNAVELV